MNRLVLVLAGLLLVLSLPLPAAWAGPVDWHEVQATADGRQWWDDGSLRVNRNGMLSVLSRFQPAESDQGELYVMEIDCGQRLYRDTAVNGLPRWGAQWQPVSGDGLIASVIDESCLAAGLQSLT
jgi:hypothetical protein